MKKQTAIAAFLGILIRGSAYATDLNTEKFYPIDESSIKIEIVDDVTGPGFDDIDDIDDIGAIDDIGGGSGSGVSDIISNIGDIVNLADQVMTIIDKNRPVVDIKVDYANAVPKGVDHWTQLQGWSKPATRKYTFSAKNTLGVRALEVTYQVHWIYGGNYNGKGKFLTGVTIEPLVVSVPWAHKLDLKAEVPPSTIANVGTSKDPIAAMQVQLQWTISSAISSKTQKVIYYVQGDGLLEEIGEPFTRGAEEKSDRETEALRQKFEKTKF